MSTFLLVHGAWHGAWCWHKLVPRLRSQGHRVLAPDLPGHGRDMTPIASVTLASCAQRIADVMASADEPVVLVGHSMGGVVISAAAEQQPHTVARLVYLAAFLLEDGQSFGEAATNDKASAVGPKLVRSADGASFTVTPDALREVFYGDCSDDDVALAELSLGPESADVLRARMHTTAARWGSIARTYIECTQDRALSLAAQREMTGRQPCEAIVTMDTSHSPFLSAPDRLADHLLAIARRPVPER